MSVPAIPNELYLRRLTVADALYRLDQYLDEAFMVGHHSVRIIHGKGSGALRDAVWNHLFEHPLVKSYELASYGEGGAGVTIVDMEQR